MRNSSRSGVALVLVALSSVVLVPIVGLGVDGASLYLIRARLSAAADAGALAGARSLSRGADLQSQRANAEAVAGRYFAANFPAGYWGTNNGDLNININEDGGTRSRVVTVRARDPAQYGSIALVFLRSPSAPGGLQLYGWTAIDAQNKRTTVRLSNVRYNVAVPESAFTFKEPKKRR